MARLAPEFSSGAAFSLDSQPRNCEKIDAADSAALLSWRRRWDGVPELLEALEGLVVPDTGLVLALAGLLLGVPDTGLVLALAGLLLGVPGLVLALAGLLLGVPETGLVLALAGLLLGVPDTGLVLALAELLLGVPGKEEFTADA